MFEEKKQRLKEYQKEYQKNYHRAKERYSKEKTAEYYAQNKEAIKEKSRERYKNLSQEEKDNIKEYQRKRHQELVQYKKEALKNKSFFVCCTKKTLKFNNIKFNKKKLHMSKKPIDLMYINKIVVSDKFELNNKVSKYFIGYQKGKIIRPLCIILPQMSGYIKYFKYGRSNMSFFY